MTYRRRDSPLHAAGAGVAALYCLALLVAALVAHHPIELAVVLAVVVAAGAGAALSPRELAAPARVGLLIAIPLALLNPLVSQDGVTVLARLGHLPVLGQRDVTLEALVYGGVLALRALDVVLVCGLAALTVDPDELLTLLRRLSLRSALTASLATRLVPVLARDAHRLADAQRARPGGGAPRLAVLRAVATGALDRAVDVAATLEVRGFATARPARRTRHASGRHALAFAAAAAGVVALVAGARAAGVGVFDTYPTIRASTGGAEAGLCLALAAIALAPFVDRRGIAR